jgi:hypothetical protein
VNPVPQPDQTKLQAWYAHRQGLDGSMSGASPAEVLTRAGWARSVGGVGPYLALHARANVSREAVDAAVARLEIHELPSARNCTYVLPASDFALGLKAGQNFSGAELRVAAKLGVMEKEIDKLCGAVLQALAKTGLEPDEIRAATGSASRSLGEEGKKKGLSTTLPVALGRLQAYGEIRRVPLNGRLDQQRYRYVHWSPSPLRNFKLSAEETMTELARRFFSWIGPASMKDFETFSGLGVKAAKAACEPLELAPVDPDLWILPGDFDRFADFKPPKEPGYALVASIDSAILLRAGREAETKGHMAVLDRGQLAGLWDYDPESESIAWTSFAPPNRALKEAVARTEKFVKDQLGDARSFSLDSPKTRTPRIAALRKAAMVK